MTFPRTCPAILEINTWVWLHEQHRQLDTLNRYDLEKFVRHRDYLWLMGVWERSEAGRAIARSHAGLQYEYRRALPDLAAQDIVGSAYAIRRYSVDSHLGSEAGLQRLRRVLNDELSVGLMLDFIPNHWATDADWVRAHPEWFVPCQESTDNGSCFRSDDAHLSHGRDPYFPAWTDTAQFDFANPQARRALLGELMAVAGRADGVRCDMAMLVLRDVFRRTWQRDPGVEFWAEAIAAVKAKYPGFLFVAEAYWGLEWNLLQLGFDYCYDKTLYDRLCHRDAPGITAHLRADPSFSERVVRFAENHDEPAARQIFGQGWWNATLLCATVPGAFLEYLGQGERTVRLPVQLGRGAKVPANPQVRHFLEQLAAFRQRLGDGFTVYDTPHPQVVAYRRGQYEFFINLGDQGVHLSGREGVLVLPPYGASVIQVASAEVPVGIDWLREAMAVSA
ncbi:alpha amylase catalytic region [Gloeobacter kilaueensis]|uniref:Alpha amylase catalytic region n=1 Tax=Gloeobacter kilaueensis (strain ATCC BAA-2537 / CCAP 1431/1 / ULC 316 / JS1) TaxID=1183438 RepID=U5QNA3_GLOK1|nr:alpha amylase catalytic region [Gloeobacter kilaueensis]AGY60396.1 alpha amylase catalytic region [Gloeobacter kilaueensis JS1]